LANKTGRLTVLTVFLALAVALFIVPGDPGPSPRAGASTTIPGPTVDEPAPVTGSSETVVLAGGCFWGVQGLFPHVKGVSQAVSAKPVVTHPLIVVWRPTGPRTPRFCESGCPAA
jgi:peptide-methionine (S)-S-oxide reductase